jgi:hypothetical protein
VTVIRGGAFGESTSNNSGGVPSSGSAQCGCADRGRGTPSTPHGRTRGSGGCAALPEFADGYLFRFALTTDRQRIAWSDPRLADLVVDNKDKNEGTESTKSTG